MSPMQFQELLEAACVHVTPVYISAVIPDPSREGRGKQMAVKRHMCAIMKPTGVCALRDRAVVDSKKYCLNCVNISVRKCI